MRSWTASIKHSSRDDHGSPREELLEVLDGSGDADDEGDLESNESGKEDEVEKIENKSDESLIEILEDDT